MIQTQDVWCLFHPRTQAWTAHFAWEGATIQPLTSEGRVTVTIARLNNADRIAERQRLLAAGLYGRTRERLTEAIAT